MNMMVMAINQQNHEHDEVDCRLITFPNGWLPCDNINDCGDDNFYFYKSLEYLHEGSKVKVGILLCNFWRDRIFNFYNKV